MTLKATNLNIADDLCNAYLYLHEKEFNAYSLTLREKIIKIAFESGGSEKTVPSSFPKRSTLSKLLRPTVSSVETLCSLQKHQYSCSLPLELNHLVNKPPFSQIKATLSQRLRKGLILRFLLDQRDEPLGRRNNILWRTNHFVSPVQLALCSVRKLIARSISESSTKEPKLLAHHCNHQDSC